MKIDNVCEETCALGPCKELIKISELNDFLFSNGKFSFYKNRIDINIENIGENTEYCFDSNGSDEFKCECNEGFDGKICDEVCSLDCGINGSCVTEINSTTGIKQSKCLCNENFTGFDSRSLHLDT